MATQFSRRSVVASAVATAVIGAAVIASNAAGAGSSSASSFVPITPCRLIDTRPAPDNVGPRATALGAGETFTVSVHGSTGNCTIPSNATAVSLNMVAISPTAASYLTVYPAGEDRPTASSLNWVAGQAPTPNAVTAALPTDGRLSLYNLSGTVHLAVDVVGYYEPSTSGPAGPTGPAGATGLTGPAGPAGEPGVDPANIIWVAPSGADFTTVTAALASISDNDATHRYVVKLAPGTYTESAGIVMKDYVDIEGSGPGTIITSAGTSTGGAAIRFNGVLHTQLRDLAVISTGGTGVLVTGADDTSAVHLADLDITADGPDPVQALHFDDSHATIDGVDVTAHSGTVQRYGMLIANGSQVHITRSNATATSTTPVSDCHALRVELSTASVIDVHLTTGGCGGLSAGVSTSAADVTLDQVTAFIDGPAGTIGDGANLINSDVTIDRSTFNVGPSVTDGSGIFSFGSTLLVRNSSVQGGDHSIYRLTGTVRAVDTVVQGTLTNMSGRCTDVLDASLAPLTC